VVINGIQQIGIGVANAKVVFNWYKKVLGFNILLFEDESTAELMLRYTRGNTVDRYAILALNMRGGGGLEIWQPTSRGPEGPKKSIQLGDPGINAMKIRTSSLDSTRSTLLNSDHPKIGPTLSLSSGEKCFYFTDPWGNLVQIVEEPYKFTETPVPSGGVYGAVIGVRSLETSISFYEEVLGYILHPTGIVEGSNDTFNQNGAQRSLRTAVLHSGNSQKGGFCELFGPSQIELIQVKGETPDPIFKNRQWGDLGYIHLCFDISDMDTLKALCKRLEQPFTVDSGDSFDMGEAAGRFGYIEDPDGTLIEFVETHKVPIAKRFGIYLNLKKRDAHKPLPRWLVKALSLHRRKKDLL
jgi:catechol 2,3-dioxygenase-like lactoylglutathione lyase family enzyme